MPTLPSGQTSTYFRTRCPPRAALPRAPSPACALWAVVSDRPADTFPSFEADNLTLQRVWWAETECCGNASDSLSFRKQVHLQRQELVSGSTQSWGRLSGPGPARGEGSGSGGHPTLDTFWWQLCDGAVLTLACVGRVPGRHCTWARATGSRDTRPWLGGSCLRERALLGLHRHLSGAWGVGGTGKGVIQPLGHRLYCIFTVSLRKCRTQSLIYMEK